MLHIFHESPIYLSNQLQGSFVHVFSYGTGQDAHELQIGGHEFVAGRGRSKGKMLLHSRRTNGHMQDGETRGDGKYRFLGGSFGLLAQ